MEVRNRNISEIQVLQMLLLKEIYFSVNFTAWYRVKLKEKKEWATLIHYCYIHHMPLYLRMKKLTFFAWFSASHEQLHVKFQMMLCYWYSRVEPKVYVVSYSTLKRCSRIHNMYATLQTQGIIIVSLYKCCNILLVLRSAWIY